MHLFSAFFVPLGATIILFTISSSGNFVSVSERSVDPALKIISHEVSTKIRFRYSVTEITSVIRSANPSSEITYKLETIIPNTAFLSDFRLEINNVNSKGNIIEKNSTSGETPISLWVRNANIISVDLLIRPHSQVKVFLAYNEVLERTSGLYQQTSYIKPELIGLADSLKIVTDIDETKNIAFVRVPFNQHDAKENALGPNRTKVEWLPTRNGETNSPCSVAQYTVQYDVKNGDEGEIIIIDGFFFHFFVPMDMAPLRKHVAFILDISGSMSGTKIQQMIQAMLQILDDLKADDYFNIITFESAVKSWNSSTNAIEASASNIADAKAYVRTLRPLGGTNANAAFNFAFQLTRTIQNNNTLPQSVGTMMFFLTDGQPSDAKPAAILSNVQTQNQALSIPIHSLAFGLGADKDFLQRIALQNYGFFQEIFEGSDAGFQLKGFYDKIASPLLTDVQVSYESEDFDISELTVTNFTSINAGAAIKVTGKLTPKVPGNGPFKLTVIIRGQGRDGPVTITKGILVSPTNTKGMQGDQDVVEKLWAHVKIQEFIELYVATGNATARGNALNLALKNGLVIPYSTMLVSPTKCHAEIIVTPIPIQPPVGTNCSSPAIEENRQNATVFKL